VSDITARIQLTRDVEELRGQVQTQGEILRGVLQMGGARFGIFMQKTDESMKTINTVLKKPAREADAFRQKIEETLDEVDRIRREAAAFKLSALVGSARIFEDALHDLRSRSELSGSDFLPVAVKLDQLYSQFALVKSLTIAAAPARDRDAAAPVPGMTENGTLILAAPRMVVDTPDLKTAPVTQRTAPAGSLDGALQSLTEHVAQEQHRDVVLQSSGLRLVPPKYQAAIKNVAIQLIRNAVMHGIEPAAARQAAGKPARGTLRLHFKVKNEGFQLLFEDDGRGIDPHTVRATAIARGVSTPEAAANMRDREAIKLIFKSRYTTLADSATDCRHGAGMSLVRRYVHESGGKIALASVPGRETRFKIILPPLETPGVEAPVEVAAAISAAPSEAAVAASQEASASIKSPQAIDALLNGQPLVQAEAAPTAVDAGQRALEADAARDAPMPTNKADSHDAHAAPEAKTHSDPNAVTVVLADTTTQVA
jgi:signal transduction histidine kinase